MLSTTIELRRMVVAMYEEQFSKRLTELRTQKGVSARDMSLSIGQNPGYIRAIESGTAFPTMANFFYICEYFNITPQEFFNFGEETSNGMNALVDQLKQFDAEQINALGFCVGGTILSNALAVLAARGDEPVASATFLTTLIDFSDTGILDVFIDEAFVKFREMQMGNGGLMKGQELASTFSFLRPNDLVWNYVVGNYLKGETPPPFDLLYWNSDSTNLPGPFYAWYLRNFYLENNLVKPGKLTVCGEKLDLRSLDLPVYIYGSREDHIVPVTAAYASTQVLPGKKRFVMGASGHIAGVINPPAKGKRSHWIRDDGKFPSTLDQWLDGATEHPGSWWTDWSGWLKSHAGKQIAAPKAYGKGTKFKAIEPAPGRYVKQKA